MQSSVAAFSIATSMAWAPLPACATRIARFDMWWITALRVPSSSSTTRISPAATGAIEMSDSLTLMGGIVLHRAAP